MRRRPELQLGLVAFWTSPRFVEEDVSVIGCVCVCEVRLTGSI